VPSLPNASLHSTRQPPTRTVPKSPANKKPINILHPVHSLAVGGLERQLATVVAGLSPSHCRHVIAVRESAAATVEIPEHVTIVNVTGDGAHFSRELVQIIDREAIDLVHIRGLTMLVDTVVAARVMRSVPVVASFHGFEDRTAVWSGVRRKLIREALQHCQARWAVSRAAADEASQRLNLPNDFFDIMPNGVDTDRFQPVNNRIAARASLDINDDAFVFLSVGNLKLIKGHDYLIRAFAQLAQSTSDRRAELILVGDDYLDGELQQLATKLNIADCVRFVGRVDDVRPWYHATNAFVLPSLAEGHCNALLEALACGLPAIATRTGGNIDTIESGSNGLLVAPGSVAELATAMSSLMQNELTREALSKSARDTAVARFGHATMLDRYLNGYCNVIFDTQQAETIRPTPTQRELANA